jgi:hypothetical protein
MRNDMVPQNWSRQQTVKNAERYVTQELKELNPGFSAHATSRRLRLFSSRSTGSCRMQHSGIGRRLASLTGCGRSRVPGAKILSAHRR